MTPKRKREAMQKPIGLATVLLSSLALAACGGIRNMQSVKSASYTAGPHNIVGVLQDADASFPRFKERLSQEMANCGVRLQFVTVPAGQSHIEMPGSDAVLFFKLLGKETVTTRTYGVVSNQYVDMYRYEVTLSDMASRQVVWKGQGDFKTNTNSNSISLTAIVDDAPPVAWAADLTAQMKKDGLLSNCDPSRAASLPPAPAVTVTPQAPQSPAAQPAQPPVQSGQPSAAPGAPQSGPLVSPTRTSFQVGSVRYDSLEQAEAAMRANAADEVVKLAPMQASPRVSLLLLVPGIVDFAAHASGSNQEILRHAQAFASMRNRVAFDADADAIRKSGLFGSVTVVPEAGVAETDFQGAAYKLWRAPSGWVLAKLEGGQEKLPALPAGDVKAPALEAMLNSIAAATATLDRP